MQRFCYCLDKITGDSNENKYEDGLESIQETDNEEQVDDEVSEGVTAPVTDDTGTEDEVGDNTQGSDEERKLFYFLKHLFLYLIFLFLSHPNFKKFIKMF